MPEEEGRIVDRMIPKSGKLAQHATALDPESAEAFVALGYANLVQMRLAAAEDAFREALALNPDQADGLHGYSQLLAAVGRIKESLAMRAHLQSVEQFIVNYTADTAQIYWLDGDTGKAVAMLQPFRPGRTLELALVEASAGRYREAAAALRENAGAELSRRHAGGGGARPRLSACQGHGARRPAAARQYEFRLHACRRAGARARVLRG
jgi:tetratricopeptide (TPR) repeat protein